MKNLYIKPEIRTEEICTETVIATSGGGNGTESGGQIIPGGDPEDSAGKERGDWDDWGGLW